MLAKNISKTKNETVYLSSDAWTIYPLCFFLGFYFDDMFYLNKRYNYPLLKGSKINLVSNMRWCNSGFRTQTSCVFSHLLTDLRAPRCEVCCWTFFFYLVNSSGIWLVSNHMTIFWSHPLHMCMWIHHNMNRYKAASKSKYSHKKK